MTWNLRCLGGDPASERKLDYLAAAAWDIALLQEVNAATSRSLLRREGWSVVDGLQLALAEVGSWKNPHGAAIVARNAWTLDRGGLVADTPTPGRGVVARGVCGDQAVSVFSWHAPNAAGEGVDVKMAGYRAALKAIEDAPDPLIVGLDSNHWSPGVDLDLRPPPDPSDPFEVENRFFSREPQHRLHDALLVYLRENCDAYEEILRSRPKGPLAVTHVRGTGGHRIPDRFDYLMISDDVDVVEIAHDYEGGVAAGSDHALVRGRFRVGSQSRGASGHR